MLWTDFKLDMVIFSLKNTIDATKFPKQLVIEDLNYLGRRGQDAPFGQPLVFQNGLESIFVHSSPHIAAEAHIESKLLVPSI